MKRATGYKDVDLKIRSNFNPHPLWRGRQYNPPFIKVLHDFNPHPLWRGRRLPFSNSLICSYFNPHPLWRGRLSNFYPPILIPIFQSTPSVKRATFWFFSFFNIIIISIHTLCEEGDDTRLKTVGRYSTISIHTLCEEGDITCFSFCIINTLFQSTPSVKRATY